MDVTLKYDVNSTPVETVYQNGIVEPNFNESLVVLTLSSSTNDYESLFSDMSNSPTNIEILFTSMGENRSYVSLTLKYCEYKKFVTENSNVKYYIKLIFDYSS